MTKSVKIFATLLLSAAFVAAAGCATTEPPNQNGGPTGPKPMFVPTGEPTFTPHKSAEGVPDRLTMDNEVLALFSEGASDEFYWADGYSNGKEFNCTWRKSSAVVADGVMSMSVVKESNGYAGAEYRTNNTYSYGFYSVFMKAARGSGIISSYFTYTNKLVWDEIDIEFLGKDTTKVQFNYFTNGAGNHTYLLNLGYDAAEEFHEYAFDWQPEAIVWFVDGKAVYRATENLPSHPMQLMMNVWNCRNADAWSGKFDPSALPATAQYKWFAYSPD